jgi:hypothetical protein
MPIPYAKPSDCIDIVPALTEHDEKSQQLEGALMQSLLDASRLFESDVFADEDYFAPAGETLTERKFYTSGTEFLRLAPYVEMGDIYNADNVIIDPAEYRHFISEVYSPTGYFLRWNYFRYGCGWNFNYIGPLTVHARWGFKCIPPDVAIAVKNMGCLMFLANPNNRTGQDSGLEETQETRLRQTYNRVMNNWQDKFHHRNLGIV